MVACAFAAASSALSKARQVGNEQIWQGGGSSLEVALVAQGAYSARRRVLILRVGEPGRADPYEIELPGGVTETEVRGAVAGISDHYRKRAAVFSPPRFAQPWVVIGESAFGEVRVLQLGVPKQWHPAACGAHALFNVRAMLLCPV